MLTCCLRSSLMVNDDTPNSYLPDWRPGMMASNLAGWYSVFRPSLAATALNRSTSQPMTALPSVSRNSFGAYSALIPTTSLPSDLTASGTLAASASSTAGAAVVVPVLPPPVSLFSPQPAATRATADPSPTSAPLRNLLALMVSSSLFSHQGTEVNDIGSCVAPWPACEIAR